MPAHPVLFAIKSLSHFDCDHFKNTFCASTHYAAHMKLGAQKQDDGKESVTTLGEHGARSIAEVMAGDEKGLRVEAGTETSAGIAELDMLHNPVAAALVLGTSNMRRMHSALTMACESLPPNMAAETTAHVTGQTEKGAHYVTKTHFRVVRHRRQRSLHAARQKGFLCDKPRPDRQAEDRQLPAWARVCT